MSTTLLYHGFGLRGYRYRSQTIESGCLIVTIEQPRSDLRCSACSSADVERRGSVCREWQTVPIGSRPVYLRMHVPRLRCWKCGVTRQAHVAFAEPYKQHTRAFARYVLELRRSMTIKDVAAHLHVSEWLVRQIEQRYLERRFARPQLKHLTQLAIDEISVGKGHRYVTVVLDLESGAIVHVGEGKGGDALTAFWRRLRASGARIEAVATDLSPAYVAAVSAHLPEAALVFDRFHLVKLLNEEFSELRRELYRDVTVPRADVSRFCVHLTRDDTGEWACGGQEARLNFLDIYRERTILALKAHCLHAKKMTPQQREKCRVACFTEMPLTEIQHVARHIPGRQIQLEPYGFVFKREFIIEKGAQQVQYVNSYAGNSEVRDGYDSIFKIAAKKDFTGRMWRTLPFVSAMHEGCDFWWEVSVS